MVEVVFLESRRSLGRSMNTSIIMAEHFVKNFLNFFALSKLQCHNQTTVSSLVCTYNRQTMINTVDCAATHHAHNIINLLVKIVTF